MANVVSDTMYNQLKQLYGGDAGKASKAKAQIESSYSTDQYNNLVSQLNSKYGSSVSTTPTTTRTKSTSTATSTPSTSSSLNSMSSNVAQNNSRNAQVGTGDVAEMPQQPNVMLDKQPINNDRFAKSWENMTAAQQRNALTGNKQLTDYISSRGLTVKKEETPATTTTTQPKQQTIQTPKQAEWDYQDNSQARMNQIADNLNNYRQTMPQLFDDESAFYNFFIDGKGRSQDQIDFLWDYFNRVKKYGKYDNMPASSLGDGLANGTIPQEYLDYVKAQDPQKYQEILSYKQDGEDRIRNESYLNDAASLAGFESKESDLPDASDPITYAKKMGYFVDEDGNWTDDNLYIKPTDEERQDVDRINTINARRMEIKNMQKNLLDDLVEQYPGVPKATLMGIVQDRTNDISREYDDLGVELVQLQGTVDYLQNERSMQAEARQQTIKNLDTAYGMYYQYSPEGISELVQSKYAATNITLDQADSGNETQKQMALDAAITPIFEQYGDIIQRSPAQVINDVIAYAKKNGVGLRQALEENFMKPLREKPEYLQMTSGGIGSWTVIGEDDLGNKVYGFVNSSTGVVVPYGDTAGYGTYGGGTATGDLYGFTDYTPITTEEKQDTLNTFMSNHPLNSDGGQCGSFVNDYLQSLGYDRLYTDPIDKKKAITNSDTASVGSVAVMDSKKYPQYGHTAIVTDAQGDKVKLLESNWGGDEKVHERRVNKSDILGYFDPSKQSKGGQDVGKFDKGLELVYQEYQDANSAEKARIAARQGKTTQQMDSELREYTGWRNANDSKTLINEIDKLLDGEIAIPSARQRMDTADTGELDPVTSFFTVGSSKQANRNWMYAHNLIHDTLGMEKLVNLKSRGATFGALSDPEREAINRVATKLSPGMDDATYKQTLRDIRAQLVDAAHGYLDNYHYEGGTVKNSANELGLKKVR